MSDNPLNNIQSLDDAGIALGAWFKSQSIKPKDAIVLIEYFFVRMAVENSTSHDDYETKIDAHCASVRELADAMKEFVR